MIETGAGAVVTHCLCRLRCFDYSGSMEDRAFVSVLAVRSLLYMCAERGLTGQVGRKVLPAQALVGSLA